MNFLFWTTNTGASDLTLMCNELAGYAETRIVGQVLYPEALLSVYNHLRKIGVYVDCLVVDRDEISQEEFLQKIPPLITLGFTGRIFEYWDKLPGFVRVMLRSESLTLAVNTGTVISRIATYCGLVSEDRKLELFLTDQSLPNTYELSGKLITVLYNPLRVKKRPSLEEFWKRTLKFQTSIRRYWLDGKGNVHFDLCPRPPKYGYSLISVSCYDIAHDKAWFGQFARDGVTPWHEGIGMVPF